MLEKSVATKKKETYKLYITLLGAIAITFIIGNLPPVGQVTEMGMRTLGVFVGCIFTWLFGYVGWGSVMGLLMASLYIPGTTATTVCQSAFGSMNTMILVWCLMFCYCLEKFDVVSYVSKVFMSKKWTTKSPWNMLVVLWIITLICSALVVNSMAALLLVWSIYYDIAKKCGIPRKGHFTGFALVTIGTVAAIAVPLMPYSSGIWFPVTLMLLVDSTLEVNIIKVCLTCWVLAIALIIILGIMGKILVKIKSWREELKDVSLANAAKTDEKVKMGKKTKWGFFYIVLLLLLMIVPSIFPDLAINAYISRLTTFGGFTLIVLLMCLTTVDGERVVTVENAIKSGVPWGVYFMFAAAIAISTVLVSEDTGIVATISSVAGIFMSSESSHTTMILLLMAFGLILTNCINNVVAIQLLTPILVSILLGMNVNPVFIIGFIGLVLDHGNILPSGSPLAAVMHGNTEWLTAKQVYLWATVGSIILYGCFALIGLPFAELIF